MKRLWKFERNIYNPIPSKSYSLWSWGDRWWQRCKCPVNKNAFAEFVGTKRELREFLERGE